MVVIDTNILIDYVRRPKSDDSLLVKLITVKDPQDLTISIITIQELYVGQSSKIEGKEQFFLKIIDSLIILPYEYEVARLAGEIMRDSENPIGFADAAIAATTIVNDAQLATLNTKDFQGIKNLELLSL